MSKFESATISRIIDTGDMKAAQVAGLSADHFFLPETRNAWGVLLHHYDEYGTTPSRELFAELVPGFSFDVLPDPVPALVTKLHEHYVYNAEKLFVDELATRANTDIMGAAEFIADEAARFRSLLHQGKASARYQLAVDRALTLGALPRIPTGFKTIDENTRGGPRVGKRIIIGGAPGAGKTTLLVQLLWRYAMAGHLVMLIAFDEEADDILIRIGQLNGGRRDDIEAGHAFAKRRVAHALKEHPNFVIIDGDEDEITVEEASAELARLRKPGQLSILGVDSIQTARVANVEKAESAKARVDLVMGALKRAGKIDQHLVFATCELNRGAYRSTKVAERVDDLATFKESGGIEYGANMALVLRSVKGGNGTVDVTVPKNRMGTQHPFRLSLNYETVSFTEVDVGDEQDDDAESPVHAMKERIREVFRTSTTAITSKAEIQRRVGGNRQAVWDAVAEMVEEGDLQMAGKEFRLPVPDRSETVLRTVPIGPVLTVPAPKGRNGRRERLRPLKDVVA